MITVFYDGSCGLCSREIAHYRRIAPDGVFDWCNIVQHEAHLAREGVAVQDAMQSLHALDHYGRIHTGVDAFVLIWQHIPSWHLAATFVSQPIIKTIAAALYRYFADWRFRRGTACKIDRTTPKQTACVGKELVNR